MTPAERAFYRKLRRRAYALSPDLARRQLAAYEIIRASLTEAELVRAINDGTVEGLLAELLSDQEMDPAFAPLRALLDQAVMDSARLASRDLPSRIQPAAFDVLNPRVVQAARDLDTTVITTLKADVREAVRQAVVQGLQEGVNPRTVARRAIRSVGLSPEQRVWVENFRAELRANDRAALRRALGKNVLTTEAGGTIERSGHAAGQGLTRAQLRRLDRLLGTRAPRSHWTLQMAPEEYLRRHPDGPNAALARAVLGEQALTDAEIDAMVEAYRKRLEAWNAESTARTAALTAQKRGQRLAWEDAIGRGVVEATRLRRSWVAVGGPTGDGRNRPEHLELHGTVVRWTELYPNGQQVPGEDDYNCRCVERIYVVAAEREPAFAF